MSMEIEDREKLEEFIKWYWLEVHGRPYDIRAEEIVDHYIEDKEKDAKGKGK